MSNDHISTSVIEQDISDTQQEIDDFNTEKTVLEKNPVENKLRIYMLEGNIGKHQIFINKLNGILEQRKS